MSEPSDLNERERTGDGPAPGVASRDGFALVCAIWISGLVAILALTFSFQARSYVALGRHATANTQARLMADAGVMLAMHSLIHARASSTPAPDWPLGTSNCRMPDGTRLSITTTDEAGRVDLNTAHDHVILSLLRGIGLGSDQAQELRDKLLDYRDGDSARRPFGAEFQDYISAGVSHGPRNGQLLSVDELGQVLGYDAGVIARLRPFVTVNSGHLGIDPAQASATLLAMLETGARTEPFEASGAISGDGLRQGYMSVSTRTTFRISVAALTPQKAGFTRVATLSLLDNQPHQPMPGGDPGLANRRESGISSVKIWSWDREVGNVARELVVTTEELPGCRSQT